MGIQHNVNWQWLVYCVCVRVGNQQFHRFAQNATFNIIMVTKWIQWPRNTIHTVPIVGQAIFFFLLWVHDKWLCVRVENYVNISYMLFSVFFFTLRFWCCSSIKMPNQTIKEDVSFSLSFHSIRFDFFGFQMWMLYYAFVRWTFIRRQWWWWLWSAWVNVNDVWAISHTHTGSRHWKMTWTLILCDLINNRPTIFISMIQMVNCLNFDYKNSNH